ncbi:MAG: FABP family protein [Mycetocola sp.]
MPIEIPTDIPSELVPLSWLIGVWEGTGVVDYTLGDDRVGTEFGQRITFAHDGGAVLSYRSEVWVLDESSTPLSSEMGYWRLTRARNDSDAGPGLLPATVQSELTTAESVEALRTDAGGFAIEASIVHPQGVAELYLGQVTGPRIDLATDAVIRSEGAQEYTAATRLYGLVDGHLLWAWDMAALGQELKNHASARLAKVS